MLKSQTRCWLGAEHADVAEAVAASKVAITCGTSGSLLCQALVRCFDTVLLKPVDQQQWFVMKATAFNSLKSLLAVSAAAKTTALERTYL